MEEVNEMSYKDALAKLEELVDKLEDPDIQLEDIASEVKKAMELINYCREKVKGFREESAALME